MIKQGSINTNAIYSSDLFRINHKPLQTHRNATLLSEFTVRVINPS